jgi:hypothetical protein
MSDDLIKSLAPLVLVGGVVVLIYMGTTGNNPFEQAISGLTTGQFKAFLGIGSMLTESGRCDDTKKVSPEDKYSCIQRKITFCSKGGLTNISGPANSKCYTDRGVPLSKKPTACMLPPQRNPRAGGVGALAGCLVVGALGQSMGGTFGAVAGLTLGSGLGYVVGTKLYGITRPWGRCPSWPDDVPCNAWGSQIFKYNSQPPGTVAGGKQLQCGADQQGGGKCQDKCCKAQSTYCNAACASGVDKVVGGIFNSKGCVTKCLKQRGC